MKSIFTRPLFINPQAYLTIPELSYIQTATPFDFTEDSYGFVINTSGRIEGKLLKTSNDYILHLDLYSIDGNCVLGEFYLNNSELNTDNFNLTQSKNIITLQFGEQSSGNITYPGLIAAWSAKGKSNDDEDRATLKDLTGNGHDIRLNGFAFSEMSGYGGYKTNMLNWKYYKNSAVILSSQNKFIIYNTLEIVTHFWDYVSKPPLGTIHRPSFKLKISGLNEDEAIYYIYRDGEDFSVSHKGNLYNGINIFPEINAEIVTEKLPYTTVFDIQNQHILDKEITFEILPEYPDALVFDGVDDYVSLDAFDSGFKTMFIECSYVSLNTILYDQRKVGTEQEDCINTSAYEAGFYGRNKYGKTYINGVYNKPDSTLIASKLSNKHILITSTFKGDYTSTPCIASSNVNKGMYCNMALYKLLGFKEALTEEQIQAVIKKYNLLDGVDEIEVS